MRSLSGKLCSGLSPQISADSNVDGCSDVGILCTQLRLSLTELDRRFSCLMEGRAYHGEAINPRGLSLWERLTRTGEVSPLPAAEGLLGVCG